MEELRTNQLPVLENGYYKGLISEQIILEDNNLSKSIGEFKLEGEDCFVHFHQHIYDVIKIASDNKAQIIAVLDEDNQYHGVINIEDTIAVFGPDRRCAKYRRHHCVVFKPNRLFVGRGKPPH